jgi:hypothetical protein
MVVKVVMEGMEEMEGMVVTGDTEGILTLFILKVPKNIYHAFIHSVLADQAGGEVQEVQQVTEEMVEHLGPAAEGVDRRVLPAHLV